MVLSFPLVRYTERAPQPMTKTPSRAEVRNFVEAFYADVRADAELGPIFERVVAARGWDAHFETMTDFWQAVAFDGPPFRGNPMIKHAQIRDIAPAQFARWLTIFEKTCRRCWPQETTDLLIERGRRMAPALVRAIDRAREKAMVCRDDMH